jgi:predicted flap endonuclease-1-like 5' DNA nuclease
LKLGGKFLPTYKLYRENHEAQDNQVNPTDICQVEIKNDEEIEKLLLRLLDKGNSVRIMINARPKAKEFTQTFTIPPTKSYGKWKLNLKLWEAEGKEIDEIIDLNVTDEKITTKDKSSKKTLQEEEEKLEIGSVKEQKIKKNLEPKEEHQKKELPAKIDNEILESENEIEEPEKRHESKDDTKKKDEPKKAQKDENSLEEKELIKESDTADKITNTQDKEQTGPKAGKKQLKKVENSQQSDSTQIEEIKPSLTEEEIKLQTEIERRFKEKERQLKLEEDKRLKTKKTDDLTQITGIGKAMEKKLNNLGIFSFKELAYEIKQNPKRLTEIQGVNQNILNSWYKELLINLGRSGDQTSKENKLGKESNYKFKYTIFEEIKDELQLGNIKALRLTKNEVEELEIPINEIDQIGPIYVAKLKEREIYYISDLLKMKPINLKKIAEADVKNIAIWYDIAYSIKDDENNPLRIEYRNARKEEEEQKAQLKALIDTPQALGRLDELDIEGDIIKELNDSGIIMVRDLLSTKYTSLIAMGFDKILIQKLIRAANLYIGLERIDKSMWKISEQ